MTLSAGKVLSVLLEHEIKLAVFSFYDFFCLCNFQCIPDLGVRCIFIAPFHVIADAAFEKDGALLYDSDLVVDFLIGELFYIASIQFNGSAGYIIETGDQADQSGFSASGTTDDTDCLPFFYRETDIRKA